MSEGIQGVTGVQGIPGPQGTVGATGLQGVTGPSLGAAYVGVTGLMGSTGLMGATGVGLRGFTGIPGATGVSLLARVDNTLFPVDAGIGVTGLGTISAESFKAINLDGKESLISGSSISLGLNGPNLSDTEIILKGSDSTSKFDQARIFRVKDSLDPVSSELIPGELLLVNSGRGGLRISSLGNTGIGITFETDNTVRGSFDGQGSFTLNKSQNFLGQTGIAGINGAAVIYFDEETKKLKVNENNTGWVDVLNIAQLNVLASRVTVTENRITLVNKELYKINNVSVNFTAVNNNLYLVTGVVTVTLPSPSINDFVTIKKTGSDLVTVTPSGSSKIEGSTGNYLLDSIRESATFVSDGVDWFII